jgi:hypothetical protein
MRGWFIRKARGRLRKEENVFTQRTWVSHLPEAGRRAISKVLLRSRKYNFCCDKA